MAAPLSPRPHRLTRQPDFGLVPFIGELFIGGDSPFGALELWIVEVK
jgi:hypothetical protein